MTRQAFVHRIATRDYASSLDAMIASGAIRAPGVIALLAEAEAGSTGRLRGHRHAMPDDSDIATRHARGFVAGALAGLVGQAELYLSGGAQHQGPDGGGPVAFIATSARGAP